METEEQKALKKISVAAAKKIPYAGTIVGPLIDVLWIVKNPSLWDQIKDQVGEFVDKKLFEAKLNFLSARLKGYTKTLEFINTLEGKTQYDELKSFQLILETDRPLFYEDSKDGDKVRQTLPLFTPMVVVHVMISNMIASLSDDDSFESSIRNKQAFTAKFETLKREYSDYAYDSVVDCLKWRMSKIEVTRKEYSLGGGFSSQPSLGGYEIECYDRFEKKTLFKANHMPALPLNYISDERNINRCKGAVSKKAQEYWEETVLSVLHPFGCPKRIPNPWEEAALNALIVAVDNNLPKN
jgi:hypothetical protein